MTKKEMIEKFGINPENVGIRNRGWWILQELDEEDRVVGAEIGDLCVKTRDGGLNLMDNETLGIDNCIGSQEDFFDCTYRYYYFKPLQ